MLRDANKLIDKLRKDRRVLAEQCKGCGNTEPMGVGTYDAQGNENMVEVCRMWWKPEVRFLNGHLCATSTHLEIGKEKKIQQGKRRVGQQKQRRE